MFYKEQYCMNTNLMKWYVNIKVFFRYIINFYVIMIFVVHTEIKVILDEKEEFERKNRFFKTDYKRQ